MTGTGILSRQGVENPSMLWLKEYISAKPDVGYPMAELINGKPQRSKG
jgi:hypothetical protein